MEAIWRERIYGENDLYKRCVLSMEWKRERERERESYGW